MCRVLRKPVESLEVVWELGVRGLGVLDMVVEKCSFYDVFLKVVFKKHVNYNEKVTFRNIRKKKKNELIASELNSFEKVRMRIYVYRRMKEGSENIDFR